MRQRESDGEENERRERDQARTIAIILWLVKHIEKEYERWVVETERDALYHHSTTAEFDIQGAYTLELTLHQRTP